MKRDSKFTFRFWPSSTTALIIMMLFWLQLLLVFPSSSNAFVARRTLSSFHDSIDNSARCNSCSRLSMYNLPPGGGDGGGDGGGGKNDIATIAKGAFSIFLIVGFFISPLGGLVLGIFNSFLVLLFLLPVIATVGFQIWQSLNILTGECPNCGAPATVMKQKKERQQPSMCFNCGVKLQANDDNTEINNVSGRTSIDDLTSERADVANIFDIFDRPSSSTTTTETSASSTRRSTSSSKTKDIIVDVDVIIDDDDNKPVQ